MRPQSGWLVGLLLFGNIGPPAVGDPQVPGYAEITAPTTGQVVSGIVTVEGTAAHPEFRRYDLAFAFPNDPTDTWFLIAEAVETTVHDSRLGIWDTSAITEGEYDLRLRVWTSSGEPLIAEVTRIHVSPAGPVPSAPTVAGLGSATPNPTATVASLGPSLASTLEAPPPPRARIGRSQIAFGLGAIAAITGLGAWAVYGSLRHGYQRGSRGRRSRRRWRTPGGTRR